MEQQQSGKQWVKDRTFASWSCNFCREGFDEEEQCIKHIEEECKTSPYVLLKRINELEQRQKEQQKEIDRLLFYNLCLEQK
jgi:hypothetical protein